MYGPFWSDYSITLTLTTLPRFNSVCWRRKVLTVDFVRSGRIMRSKLHEFVSRKGEMLFRPLGSDEIPIMERGAQSNTKGTIKKKKVPGSLAFGIPVN